MEYQCIYCEIELYSFHNTELPHLIKTNDHFIPKCRGGSDESKNILHCCKFCNNQKGYLYPWTWLSKLERGVYDHPRKIIVVANLARLVSLYDRMRNNIRKKEKFKSAKLNSTRTKIRHPAPDKRAKRKSQGLNEQNEFVKKVDQRLAADNLRIADELKKFVKKK
jgi:hypothetical protein